MKARLFGCMAALFAVASLAGNVDIVGRSCLRRIDHTPKDETVKVYTGNALMNRVAGWGIKTVFKCTAVLLVWAVIGGMVTGCAGTRIRRLSGAEFVTQADQIGRMNSFSWTCYVGSSRERAYLEFGFPAIIGKGTRTTVYWTLLSELPDDLAAQLRAGKPPWQPWQPKSNQPAESAAK